MIPCWRCLFNKEDPDNQVLAGKSTLNWLELSGEKVREKERYKKIVLDHGAVDRLLVEVFLQAHREEPKEIILDVDSTDDPLHGNQEGRFFHGYYGHYCYLPLYIFSGEHLLCARVPGRMGTRRRGAWRIDARRAAVSAGVAGGEDYRARGFRILPGSADGVVPGEPGGLRVGAGEE